MQRYENRSPEFLLKLADFNAARNIQTAVIFYCAKLRIKNLKKLYSRKIFGSSLVSGGLFVHTEL